jgi:dTDP-6-deoxy-L-talose 4-dehydrogenase (NAD+)
MVLITGITGFLGKYICKYLPKKKYIVISRKKIDLPKNFKVIVEKDIFCKNVNWWCQKLSKVKVVIHLAWTINNKYYYNSPDNAKCFNGTLNLAIACKKKKIQKFIGIGTESEDNFINYKNNNKENNLYSFYKYLTYLILTKIFSKKIKNFMWIRIPYLYGEGEHKFKLKTSIEKSFLNKKKIKLKNQNKIKNFVEVSKAAKIIVKTIFRKYSKNNLTFNINGEKITVKRFADTILKKIKYSLQIKTGS